jgi:SAM-dependent methyltransferase
MDEKPARALPESDLTAILDVLVSVAAQLAVDELDPPLADRLGRRLRKHGALGGTSSGEMRGVIDDLCRRVHWAMGDDAAYRPVKGYLLDNQQAEAGTRFDALATLFDPGTFRRIEALGIADGWRCWEVGAGGPSVPSWLAARAGYVLATDIDPVWLPGDGGYEVRRHDVGREAAPDGGFDLVHARLVLVHVEQRAAALAAMIGALRPGGWLLLEEADPAMQPLVCPDEAGEAERLANKLKRDFRTLMVGRGVDLAFGRTLPRLLRAAGLTDIGADAAFPMRGPACDQLEQATVEQIRDRLTAAGLATTEEIDRHLANVAAGTLDLATSPMISAWGRR